MKFIFILLSSLVLGSLLVVIVSRDSSSKVVSGQEWNKNKHEEPFGRTTRAFHMRKLGFGSIMHHEETSLDSKNGKVTSKISGDENDGLKKSFRSLQAPKNDLQHMIMRTKPYLKATKFVIPRNSHTTNTNTKCSQDCKAVKGSSEKSSRPKRQIFEKHQGFDQTAKEIESLFSKDYKGRPAHKPPINNHGPNN
ncbi:uncharacterized protein [Cicer arietinum]|uniref:Uncharacterized protein LOC101504760 isoform X2 n=1 Tax=Cicer arietinum TaxID=3827 RepID=A0A1S2XN89_CICAR|nr:uncharacterized protein LOC101504760 isoform X2 [Cicer arietinum]